MALKLPNRLKRNLQNCYIFLFIYATISMARLIKIFINLYIIDFINVSSIMI